MTTRTSPLRLVIEFSNWVCEEEEPNEFVDVGVVLDEGMLIMYTPEFWPSLGFEVSVLVGLELVRG
ncbi:hypothetical protein LINPERPRIM_LOCUS14820 [Linum perenne]